MSLFFNLIGFKITEKVSKHTTGMNDCSG